MMIDYKQNIPLMKKSINKKDQNDILDSNTFLKSVVQNIKINEKTFPLDDFQQPPSAKEKSFTKPPSVKPT